MYILWYIVYIYIIVYTVLHPISVGPFRIICPAADIPKDRLRDANGPQAKTESTVVFLGSCSWANETHRFNQQQCG